MNIFMSEGGLNVFAEANLAGWKLPVDRRESFPVFIHETIRDEMSGKRSPDFYRNRLRGMGFTGLDRVLDAGCGTGQWAAALALENGHIDAVDINDDCLAFTRLLLTSQGITNGTVTRASIDKLPFNNATFEAITCYSVLMLCDAHPVDIFKEFHRVLKPGGKLYLSVDTFGWYLHLLIDRGLVGGDKGWIKTFYRRSKRTFINLFTGKELKIMLSERTMRKYLTQAGFDIRFMTHEGGINLFPGKVMVEASLPKRFYGFQAIIDTLASKSS
ncbi:MAG: methyltransferase domain-containing protein [Cyclobacteriaceae bacterium]|nr:methyltransferase domain-containing protein [Cyclobacteriaceae bacterium]